MSLIKELKRRNVFKVGTAYIVVSWLILQVLDSVVPIISAPEWVSKVVLILLIVGLPMALIFAWAFEMTPEGLKKEAEVNREDSITQSTSQKINYIIIGALVLIIGGFVYDKLSPDVVEPAFSDTASQKQNQVSDEITQELSPADVNSINDKSIAVLPFTNMAANDKNESFTLGIHDDLLTHLSKISALKVISRTSVLRYKSTQKPIAEIAQELGVKNILEGSVQSSGHQIRINVQLIDADTDEHLWAEIYDRKLTTENIFNIQTEISTKIAAALKAKLSPEEQTSLAKKATQNLDAYNAYLAGRQRMINRTSASLKQALALFERATELDPNYALAYVGQADTLNLLNSYSDLTTNEMLERGEPLITKALQIDPLLAEAHTSKASYLWAKNEPQAAEISYKLSLKLNPNYATTYHWYSNFVSEQFGRHKEGLKLIRKAVEIDPLSPIIQKSLASKLINLGRYQEALKQYHRIIEFAPDYPGANSGIASLNTQLGKFDQAVFWGKKALLQDKGNASRYITLGISYLDIGDVDKAKAMLAQLEIQFPNHEITNAMLFLINKYQGSMDKWFDGVEQWYQTVPNLSFPQQIYANALVTVEEYKKALPVWLSLYADKDTGVIKLNTQNIDYIILFAWTYQQLGQDNQAQQLISQLQQTQISLTNYNRGWSEVLLEAVQDHHHLAAVAYAKLIDNGSYQGWWDYEKYPFLKQTKKQPEYIAAHQRLMDILKTQRENLAKLELKGQSE